MEYVTPRLNMATALLCLGWHFDRVECTGDKSSVFVLRSPFEDVGSIDLHLKLADRLEFAVMVRDWTSHQSTLRSALKASRKQRGVNDGHSNTRPHELIRRAGIIS